jgi:hypothetical protein
VCDEILREPLQRADLGRVATLAPGDMMLVDSSHYALKDSDVVTFMLELLPALPAGVLVGFHDVFLPDDYPWWFTGRWYSEQYLLAAWLLGVGGGAKVLLASHYCATEPTLRARLDAVWELPGDPYGTSFWFET